MPDPLLKPGDRVVLPPRGRFVARDHFVQGLGSESKVAIAYIQGPFERWFREKVEEPSGESTLLWYEMQRNTGDPAIIAELGGIAQVISSLSVAFALMEQQSRGDKGPLASNGWGNVFYVPDISGQPRSLYVHWCDEGWGIDAEAIIRQSEWPIRDRVFVLEDRS